MTCRDLSEIVSLFPSNPICAGLGNRPTDVLAYTSQEVGLPSDRTFIVNPKGAPASLVT